MSDGIPAPGTAITLSATVNNTGDGESPATSLRFYRSPDATITTADTVVATDAVAGLSASGSSSVSVGLRAPSSAGTYYYGACVDAVAGESDTTNNCSSAVTVTIPGWPPAPDLRVSPLQVSDSNPLAGGALTFRAVVKNTGDEESPATTLRYYLWPDATIMRLDTVLGTDAVGALAPSGTSAHSISLTAPTSAGTYYYGACTDAVADESNTMNNCSSAIRVGVPWPDVTVRVAVAATVAPGETFSMSVSMVTGSAATPAKNLRIYRSADTTITRSDTRVGTVAMEKIPSYSWRRKSITLTAPGTTGEWYYGACVDLVLGDPDSTIACSTGGPFTIVQVAIVGASDLVVSEMRSRGGTLVARVRNDGTGESFPTRLWFYRSSDAAISASNDKRLDSGWRVLAVQPNTTYYRDLTYTFPEPQPEPGIYYYWACVAAPRGETDTTNNCSSNAVEVEHRSNGDLRTL